jgi:hypothetical protein
VGLVRGATLAVRLVVENTGPRWAVTGRWYGDERETAEALLAAARWLAEEAVQLDQSVARHPAGAPRFKAPT